MSSILEKYNKSIPRYTSFPPVPNWRNHQLIPIGSKILQNIMKLMEELVLILIFLSVSSYAGIEAVAVSLSKRRVWEHRIQTIHLKSERAIKRKSLVSK